METEIEEKICQTLFYFIPAVPRLKKPFQRWVILNTKDKTYIDEEISNSFECQDKMLYKSLKEAFVRWDLIQDTEGAPGFIFDDHNGPKCSNEVQEEIIRILKVFEMNIDKLLQKRTNKYQTVTYDEQFNNLQVIMHRSKSITDMHAPRVKNKEKHRKTRKIQLENGYVTD